jgi:hypothetical protein
VSPGERVRFTTTGGKQAEGVVVMEMNGKVAVRIDKVDGGACRRHVTLNAKQLEYNPVGIHSWPEIP